MYYTKRKVHRGLHRIVFWPACVNDVFRETFPLTCEYFFDIGVGLALYVVKPIEL